jgi:hypothetical protein
VKSNIRPARHVRTSTDLNKNPSGKEYHLSQLKYQIKALSEKDRQELFDYLLLLQQEQKPTSDSERKLNMWTDSLNIALTQILGNTHSIFPPVLLPQAKKILKDVTEFLSVNGLGDMKTTEVKVMYNLLAKILVNHASGVSANIRIPLSMKLVLQTQTPILSLFDNHFPGYVKAKLIKQILFAGLSGITHDSEED